MTGSRPVYCAMLIVISPAKSLDYTSPLPGITPTSPLFVRQSAALIKQLRPLSPAALAALMSISDKLAQLNVERYASWSPDATAENARPAAYAFNGDVYEGLDIATLAHQQVEWLQQHLRILSGLYGVLRPLDLMQPYRLEMGTRLENSKGHDLYAFWGSAITDYLNQQIQEGGATELVNLASDEYFKSVRPAGLAVSVITPVFEDWKDGKYKIISFYAKRARGLMVRYAAQHQLEKTDRLKAFAEDGYCFAADVSDEKRWVFRRKS